MTGTKMPAHQGSDQVSRIDHYPYIAARRGTANQHDPSHVQAALLSIGGLPDGHPGPGRGGVPGALPVADSGRGGRGQSVSAAAPILPCDVGVTVSGYPALVVRTAPGPERSREG